MRRLIVTWLQNFIVPLGILLFGIIIASALILFKNSAPSLPPQEQTWPIDTMVAEPSNIQPEILLQGRVESRQTSTLKAAVTAYVKSTPALEGDAISDGEIIMELNPIDAQLLLEQHEAQVSRIESELLAEKNRKTSDEQTLVFEKELIDLLSKSVQREQQLSKRNLSSQSQVESAELSQIREKIGIAARELALKNYQARLKQLEANLARAKAERNLAALNVQRTRIKAPYDGIISKRFVSIGDRVQPNDSLIEIYNTNHLEIRAQVSTTRLEALSQALQSGQTVRAKLIDKSTQIPIELDRLAGEIEIEESGIDALFEIKSSHSPLRLGEVVKMKAFLPKISSVISVPRSSLFETEEHRYIYQVIPDIDAYRLKAVKAKVVGEIYEEQKNYVLLKTTLQSGDLILMTRLPYARDGLKVTIREK